ncbi:hypothetical protein A6A29_06005 [Streptomyces sp. TSRI0281]|nr:hypothetical protein A6A29_06005 [Streptomyces sp. TSRI0281]
MVTDWKASPAASRVLSVWRRPASWRESDSPAGSAPMGSARAGKPVGFQIAARLSSSPGAASCAYARAGAGQVGAATASTPPGESRRARRRAVSCSRVRWARR